MSVRDDPEDKDLAARYRAASTEQPPAGLDARILAAAREAAVPPRRPQSSFAARWRVPFALAASVVLATSLTVMVREQRDDPSQLAAPAAPIPPAPVAVPTEPGAAPAAPGTPAAKSEAMPAPAAKAPAARARPATAQPQAGMRAPERAVEDHAPGPAAAATRDAATSSGNLGSAATLETESAQRKAARSAAPAPAALSAPRSDRTERAAGAAATPSVPAGEALERSPERWLEEIRGLLREGRKAEADARLAAFRKRYPDYRLPDDLKSP